MALLSFSSSAFFPWLLLVLSLCTICFCNKSPHNILCTQTERSALIQFKNNLTDKANRLSSWSGDDCCSWSGVVCNDVTGHVLEIRLRGPDDGVKGHCHGSYDTDDELEEASKQMLGGNISSSLIKLVQLRYLDLSCNDFGFIPIPAFIGSLKNLTYLNISKSQFGGEVPKELGSLSVLRVLGLQDDKFFSNLYLNNLRWLRNLKQLQYLDMAGINLANSSDWLQVISTLPLLQELHLSSCSLSQIPSDPTTVSFTSLMILDLSMNIFDSLLPGWIFSLHNLESLDLTSCFFGALDPGTHTGFHSLFSLRTLRVSGNNFGNSSFILNGLFSLSYLRILDISNCNISGPVLGNLQNFSSIVHLDLSNNQIVEEIPKSLRNLCNLITLDLQSNKFYGNVSELLERLCECKSPKLEILAMRGNYLTGRLPRKLGKLKNLFYIDLAYNNLTGTIPDSLGSLSLLKVFQMNVNEFEGSIPDTIGGLSSLQFLDLSFNKLNGSLPVTIGQLEKLSFVTLHHNRLTGVVTETHFAKLTALETLWIGDNMLVFKLTANNWIPPFQLSTLRIGSCSLGPQFPSWVQSQKLLTELDLANGNISDIIPHWFWTTFSAVSYLNISKNDIQGKLGDVSFLAQDAIVDLSFNHFNGLLPRNFNKPNLWFLDLSHNNISGSLDQFLCSEIQEPQLLNVLNLGNNNISGVIPDCWMNWDSLVILNLDYNKVSGIIPSSLGKISSLKSLHMRNNKLSGNFPVSVLNSNSLVNIEFAENGLTGRIPASIGGASSSLKFLSLRSNQLEGKIPDEICRLTSIQILDLSLNDLFGNIPTCFTNFSVISGRLSPSSPTLFYEITSTTPYLGSNNLIIKEYKVQPETASLMVKGQVSLYSSILNLVTEIDLSNNNLSGPIPSELGTLKGLRYLNLSRNDLSSSIPETIDEMGLLESLDLSVNRLDEKISMGLSRLTSLSLLNVSYNNLIGEIPTSTQLQSMSEFNFIGNALCGAPLSSCQQTSVDSEEVNKKSDESDGFDWILVICAVGGLIVGFWIVVAPLFISKQWRTTHYRFLDTAWINMMLFFKRFTIRWHHRIIKTR